ncbi:MAG: hypothetical protein M3408_03980 [Actinomycetota bacterium]|nr:hypothetical protein [Actinomycetota bacterium]
MNEAPISMLIASSAAARSDPNWSKNASRVAVSLLDVVVDFRFLQRVRREHCKRLIEDVGGRRRLLYLKVDPALLRQRLDERSRRFDANAAFPITQDLLTSYFADFEEPNGEGEEVLTSPLRPSS